MSNVDAAVGIDGDRNGFAVFDTRCGVGIHGTGIGVEKVKLPVVRRSAISVVGGEDGVAVGGCVVKGLRDGDIRDRALFVNKAYISIAWYGQQGL